MVQCEHCEKMFALYDTKVRVFKYQGKSYTDPDWSLLIQACVNKQNLISDLRWLETVSNTFPTAMLWRMNITSVHQVMQQYWYRVITNIVAYQSKSHNANHV